MSKRLIPVLYVALLLLGGTGFAEENNVLNFVHRLEWSAVEDVYYYKIVIQLKTNDDWVDNLVNITEVPFLEVSLKPGDYRYQVVLYNVLEKESEKSEWFEFKVLHAVMPFIYNINPLELYLNEDDGTIKLNGKGFLEESKIRLVPISGDSEILPENRKITSGGDSAELSFDITKLKSGFYNIVIENPGGLDAMWRGFNIRKTRPEAGNFAVNKHFDISIQEGFAPFGALYGTFNELLETSFHPVGAVLRAAIIPIRKKFGFFGVEFEGFWHFINAPRGYYIVSAHYFDLHFNVLYQKWFLEKTLALNIRAGGGFAVFTNMERTRSEVQTTSFQNTWIPIMTGGVSVSWMFRKPLYVDVGLNYVHIFSVDNSPPGYIRPAITLGVQF